jgi:hypothetical protein
MSGSGEIEPGSPALEPTQPTRERKPRKRSAQPKTSEKSKRCRTLANDGRREPAAHTVGLAKRRRGRRVQKPPTHDTQFWVAIILVVGFVAVGLILAINGDGAVVFHTLSAVVGAIVGYLYARSRGCK